MPVTLPVALALASAAAAGASAERVVDFTYDVAVVGVESWDAAGSEHNTIISVDLSEGALITALGWDLTIETVGESWRSEARFRLLDEDHNPLVSVTPGANDDSPGTSSYSSRGLIDLMDGGLEHITLPTDTLLIEFFESYDDAPGVVDAYVDGAVRFNLRTPPSPSGALLFAVAGVFASRRR